MKTSKHLLRTVLVLALVLAVVGTVTGCFGPKDKILLDQESYTCEYGEIFLVPMATCTNGEEVTVQIFDADGYEVPVEYGTATLEKGEYKMVFTAGDVTREVPVICADTTAPKIFVSVAASAAVGHPFVLPSVATDDLSGVNNALTKVELYKADESTPVLSVPGESIIVEDVGYYTLKITAVDNEGNVGTTEKKIATIVRPDTEVLQDFSQTVAPFHQWSWGGGDPWFQWYEEYDGKQGVIGLGCDNYTKVSDGLNAYIWWTNLGMENLDLSGATGFTIKLKAENCRALYFKPNFNRDITLSELGEGWIELYVDLVNATDLFEDMSKASIGFAVAPAEQFTGPCIWIDEVIVRYTPYTMYSVTVEDGSINYDSNRVPEGFKATVTHDASKTPVGKAFSYYLLNGEKLVGDTFIVTGDIVLTPVYVDKVEELPIPEGSVLVSDFSTAGAPWNNPNWGSGACGLSSWYGNFEGVAGVQAFGAAQGGAQYTQWTSVIPLPKIYDDANGFEYHGYTTITLRLKVNKDAIRALYIGDTAVSYEFLGQVPVSNEWTTVTLPINDSMGVYYLMIGTSDGAAVGESVWIDQVWVTKGEVAEPEPTDPEPTDPQPTDPSVTEQAIPEGSVLVNDFSAESSAIWNNPNWGTGPVGQTAWYAQYDGVAGVQAFGTTRSGEQYTMWTAVLPLPIIHDAANGFDYSQYTTITLRLKVDKDKVRAIYLGDTAGSYEFLEQIPVSNEWTTVTLDIKPEMGVFYLMLANHLEASGEMVWIDQVYIQ